MRSGLIDAKTGGVSPGHLDRAVSRKVGAQSMARRSGASLGWQPFTLPHEVTTA